MTENTDKSEQVNQWEIKYNNSQIIINQMKKNNTGTTLIHKSNSNEDSIAYFKKNMQVLCLIQCKL